MSLILMIDDDAGLAAPLVTYFERYDLALEHADHPRVGLDMLAKSHESGNDYCLLILDIMLPDMDGFEVCRTIRAMDGAISRIPIIMLTARGELTDRIVGLELGADDYLPKPFDPRELVARIQSILKRSQVDQQALTANEPPTKLNDSSKQTPIQTGPLTIDLQRQEVWVNGEALELTTREFTLLALFVQDQGRVWSRDDIMNHLRGIDSDFFSRVIDISISRLRKKLKPLDPIKTIWGQGYRWSL